MHHSPPIPAEVPPFRPIGDLLREHARAAPQRLAIVQGAERWTWAELDRHMDRIAAGLQRDGLVPGDVVVLAGAMSPTLAVLYLGAVRAGMTVAPLAHTGTAEAFVAMCRDAAPRRIFVDRQAWTLLQPQDHAIAVCTDPQDGACPSWPEWLPAEGSLPAPVQLQPQDPFNIIYSSGTTGSPKGIVQPQAMRWMHIQRAAAYGYGPDAVTLLSTPLYSNTTLVAFFPTLGFGGTVVLQPKFEAGAWLAIAQQERVTHTMLVPVQYGRLLAHPTFDAHDLGSFRMKFCTSAPFAADLKAEVLRRWPGGLVEMYGMTEGGGTCVLQAHLHPDKLHTVGRPSPGHDIRLIDDDGIEVAAGGLGEVVGRSPAMMTGYHRQPQQTEAAEWWSPDGLRFIRTGDIGRFDAEGFLTLLDRKKDMIISGGFNIYPSDLEAKLKEHPAVLEAAVVGVPSVEWGETPVAHVECKPGAEVGSDELRQWVNARLGRTQRLSALHLVQELPRSPIGKVLKRQLRDPGT